MKLDLTALRREAEAALSRTVSGPPVYFMVMVPGGVLLELVERAEKLESLEKEENHHQETDP